MNQEQINRIRNLVREWRKTANGTLTYAERQGITTHAILAESGQLARCARELEELLDEIAPETKSELPEQATVPRVRRARKKHPLKLSNPRH